MAAAWEEDEYVRNGPQEPNFKAVRSVAMASKQGISKLPAGPNTVLLEMLTGRKTTPNTNTARKILNAERKKRTERNLQRQKILDEFKEYREAEQSSPEVIGAEADEVNKANEIAEKLAILPTAANLARQRAIQNNAAKRQSRKRRGKNENNSRSALEKKTRRNTAAWLKEKKNERRIQKSQTQKVKKPNNNNNNKNKNNR